MLDYDCLVNFAVFPCEVRFIRLVVAHKPISSYTLEPSCIPLATISHSDSLYEENLCCFIHLLNSIDSNVKCIFFILLLRYVNYSLTIKFNWCVYVCVCIPCLI